MTTAITRGTQPPAPHVADSHDRIRVHGARENNLKDVNVEIPKRRLTVFTGVSGSGKSSLVFDTIAAESQRLINETYSAFVQGFMPTLARPDVDVLEGLTTAIIVDQQRMGADARSTVGTATDANTLVRGWYPWIPCRPATSTCVLVTLVSKRRSKAVRPSVGRKLRFGDGPFTVSWWKTTFSLTVSPSPLAHGRGVRSQRHRAKWHTASFARVSVVSLTISPLALLTHC